VALVRLSGPARRDIAAILRASEAGFGAAARGRYQPLLAVSLRRIAAEPLAVPTQEREELGAGVRSLHIRHCRDVSGAGAVAAPVHVIFYRLGPPGVVEVARVLHERMEPERHVADARDR